MEAIFHVIVNLFNFVNFSCDDQKNAFMNVFVLCLCFFISVSVGQLPGNLQPEVHPSLTYQTCTTNGGCQTQQRSIVLDSNWRWTHLESVFSNCYTGNLWNSMQLKVDYYSDLEWFCHFYVYYSISPAASVCPDPVTCAQSCVIEGVNYQQTYGISTNGNSVRMNFVTVGMHLISVRLGVVYFGFYFWFRRFSMDSQH
jgi:cellulose 1,4-beta-cellobiosidase